MSWEILAGLITLFSFGVAVINPIIKLNTSIIKLNDSLDQLKSVVKSMQDDNESSRKRMWEHNNNQDILLDNLVKRLNRVEHTLEVVEKLHPELLGIVHHVPPVSVHLNKTDSQQL